MIYLLYGFFEASRFIFVGGDVAVFHFVHKTKDMRQNCPSRFLNLLRLFLKTSDSD